MFFLGNVEIFWMIKFSRNFQNEIFIFYFHKKISN